MHLWSRAREALSRPRRTLDGPLTEDVVREALREVMDPEVGMNIVDLGLVRRVEVRPDAIDVVLVMTTPACPMGEMIMDDARDCLGSIAPEGVAIDVELAHEPPWSPAQMSDEAKMRLGWEPAALPETPTQETDTMSDTVLDVRTIIPRERHPKIFGAYHALAPGGSFQLVNDHDPKPLYYQFQAELGGKFEWSYLESGPEVWRVRIGKPG
jgi:uncharacterized protein (DUF2249 family)